MAKGFRLVIHVIRIIAVVIIGTTLAGCQGNTTDGGWFAHGQSGVYFLQISGGTGTVDYADNLGFGVNRFHGSLIIHNDNTIEVDGMYDGELHDCTACSYQLANGNLSINYTYGPVGSQTSGTLTLSSSDVSTYEQAVNALGS